MHSFLQINSKAITLYKCNHYTWLVLPLPRAVVKPSLGHKPFVSTYLPLLHISYSFGVVLSFPYARYPVWDAHLVHGISGFLYFAHLKVFACLEAVLFFLQGNIILSLVLLASNTLLSFVLFNVKKFCFYLQRYKWIVTLSESKVHRWTIAMRLLLSCNKMLCFVCVCYKLF